MKKLLFLLFLSAIILNHNALAITALQYASLSTKAKLDELLQKAEKASISKEETARIRTLYVSLRQTQPKTAAVVKDKIKQSETLATLLPDIAGTQKIISTKTGTTLSQAEKREIAKEAIVKTNDIIKKYELEEIDQVEVKEDITVIKNVIASVDIITNSNISDPVGKEIEKHKNIQIILDDEDIEVDDIKVAKKEDELEDDLGFSFEDEPEVLKREVVSKTTVTTQTKKLLDEIGQEFRVHAKSNKASERFDAYKETARLISEYVATNGDQEEISRIRSDFIEQLIQDIKDECKQFEKEGLVSTIKMYIKDRCFILDSIIEDSRDEKNIARLKGGIKNQKNWVDEYNLYTLPVVTNLQKIKDIFSNQERIQLIFGNEINNEQKRELQLLVRKYILGAWSPENLMVKQYNEHSIGGLLDRYVTYINELFIKHREANDQEYF